LIYNEIVKNLKADGCSDMQLYARLLSIFGGYSNYATTRKCLPFDPVKMIGGPSRVERQLANAYRVSCPKGEEWWMAEAFLHSIGYQAPGGTPHELFESACLFVVWAHRSGMYEKGASSPPYSSNSLMPKAVKNATYPPSLLDHDRREGQVAMLPTFTKRMLRWVRGRTS
jgi:hypothetical protein